MLPSDTNANNTRHKAPSSSESPLPTQRQTAPLPVVAPVSPPSAPVPPEPAMPDTRSATPALTGIPGAQFTPTELAKLAALRENYPSHVEVQERLLDELRLEFARWLVEHGRLNEA
ncbi:MAG TPA: hypothetical protein VKQ36_12195 [Ktedonobacterales bacterium]|nr:hypothetical protein [Ktedonobacterales bacterium]